MPMPRANASRVTRHVSMASALRQEQDRLSRASKLKTKRKRLFFMFVGKRVKEKPTTK
jgi:hypothetical protein